MRPPEVVMRLVTVYDWPATPPASHAVVLVVVFESSDGWSAGSLKNHVLVSIWSPASHFDQSTE